MLDLYSLIDKLAQEHKLAQEQYEMLIEGQDASLMAYAAKKADKIRRNIYNNLCTMANDGLQDNLQ